jgi:hypothetical protein
MALSLSESHKTQIEAFLGDHGIEVPLSATWDPDLTVKKLGHTITIHDNRAISVDNVTLDGGTYKGRGFVDTMMSDLMNILGQLSEEASASTSPTKSNTASAPPTRGLVIRANKLRPSKVTTQVEQNGRVLRHRGA